jgi:hypothetical protein
MKIAVCISGQLRNFKQGFKELEEKILSKLPSYDIFLSSWRKGEVQNSFSGGWRYEDEGSIEEALAIRKIFNAP